MVASRPGINAHLVQCPCLFSVYTRCQALNDDLLGASGLVVHLGL